MHSDLWTSRGEHQPILLGNFVIAYTASVKSPLYRL